jgi:hypothetical protein
MVMTCREIEVAIVIVIEAFEESMRRGARVPPDL